MIESRPQLPIRNLHRELRAATGRTQSETKDLLTLGLHRISQRRVCQPSVRPLDQSRCPEAECRAAEYQVLAGALLQVPITMLIYRI